MSKSRQKREAARMRRKEGRKIRQIERGIERAQDGLVTEQELAAMFGFDLTDEDLAELYDDAAEA